MRDLGSEGGEIMLKERVWLRVSGRCSVRGRVWRLGLGFVGQRGEEGQDSGIKFHKKSIQRPNNYNPHYKILKSSSLC